MNKLEFELNSFAVFFQITFICKLQTAFVATMFIVNKSLYTLFTFVLFAYNLDAPQSQPAPDSEFPCEICGKTFTTPKGRSSHKGRVHKKTSLSLPI